MAESVSSPSVSGESDTIDYQVRSRSNSSSSIENETSSNSSSPVQGRKLSTSSSGSSSPSTSRKTSQSSYLLEEVNGLWVFGYGSLCWHQGFKYDKVFTGYVKGFSRKFWQGNTTHRGTVKKPGRVATLVQEKDGIVWGRAFQVQGEDALPYLNNRECKLGGYLTTFTTFYPRGQLKPFPAVVYLATSSNDLWLGEAPLREIADQIIECSGNSGHNVEYLLRLAEFVREHIPEAVDEHLFSLEFLVRTMVEDRKMCLRSLMGDTVPQKVEVESPADEAAAVVEVPQEQVPRRDSFQFSARMPSKKLRCVNI